MKRIFIILAVVLGLYACDDEYLNDGGISDAHVNMTTYDFLKSHPELDTLALLIERGGFVDAVNATSTLFATNNSSINKYVNTILAELRQDDPNAEFTVDSIPVDTLKKYLGGYIFGELITRDDLNEDGQIYDAIDGEERKVSLELISTYNNWLSTPADIVYFTFKNEEWDDLDIPGDVPDDKVTVRTSNILTTNGVVHVLQGNHTLFNYKTN
jgi:hypothetical protein